MDLGQVKDLLHLENDHVMYFFCGSKEFMSSVAGQLASYGVPQSRLAFESFGPSEAGDVLAQPPESLGRRRIPLQIVPPPLAPHSVAHKYPP